MGAKSSTLAIGKYPLDKLGVNASFPGDPAISLYSLPLHARLRRASSLAAAAAYSAVGFLSFIRLFYLPTVFSDQEWF
jgi:hypothetical protein